MMGLSRRSSWSVAGTAALSLLFFVLYYLYLWLVVDLRLIYHGGGTITNFPIFYLECGFFREFLSCPGGLVEYASAFLAQFFYIGWAGALVATVQAWLMWLCTGTIMRAVSGQRLRWVRFIPPILLLGLYALYSYPFGIAMGLLVAMGFVCLYMGTSSERRPADLLVFLALSTILYAVAGGVYLLFVVVCGFYEMFFRRRPALGLSFLLAAPVIAYIGGAGVFNISTIDVFECFMPRFYRDMKNMLVMVYALYLLLPLALVGLKIAQLMPRFKGMLDSGAGAVTVSPEAAEKSGQSSLGRFIAWSAGEAAAMFAPLLAIFAGVLVACFCHNTGAKTMIAADYYASNKMWHQVLEASARYPGNKFVNHSANRALYHTGRLAQEMFTYGQQPGALMLPAETGNPVGWWRLFDTYIDLGQMNLAESMLVLCMEMHGERPILLKRLALVNMVKGNTGAARVCLGALSRTLFDAGWAMEYLAKIERDPNLSTDKEVQQLRSMILAIDRDFKSVNENILLDLLDKNKHNRMAFEYLMAFYLLTGQFDKFAGNLGRLDDFDYARIPRVYEEAILLYNYTRKTRVELHGCEISPESQERFDNFVNIYISQYGANKALAFNELARDYGDSYLFYSVYGRSGMKK
jgi:hypothetical protein